MVCVCLAMVCSLCHLDRRCVCVVCVKIWCAAGVILTGGRTRDGGDIVGTSIFYSDPHPGQCQASEDEVEKLDRELKVISSLSMLVVHSGLRPSNCLAVLLATVISSYVHWCLFAAVWPIILSHRCLAKMCRMEDKLGKIDVLEILLNFSRKEPSKNQLYFSWLSLIVGIS